MADPLESLLMAIGSEQNSADSLDTRRSQRVSARKRESEAIERALGAPKVFRARGEDGSVSTFSGMKRQYPKSNMQGKKVDKRFEALMEQVDPWIGGASDAKVNVVPANTFPSLSRVPTASELLHALAANASTLSTPFSIPTNMGYPMMAMAGIMGGQQAQDSQVSSSSSTSTAGPAPPSLRNLVLPQDFSASAAAPLQASFLYPYFFSPAFLGAAPALAPAQSAFSAVKSQLDSIPSVGPIGFSPSLSASAKPPMNNLSPFSMTQNGSAPSTTQLASPDRETVSSLQQRQQLPTLDASFAIIGRAPKRISENTQVAGGSPPVKRQSGAMALTSASQGSDQPHFHLRPESPCSSHSDDHSEMRVHYSGSAPHSPHSDEDSTCTMRDGSGEFSGASSVASSTTSGIELTNSPALLPGCGIYSEYIRDLRSVCSACSSSGRLKSKKKPLVDSLLLLAFFGDGIKKTPNGLGYIIEDSNIARELMNIVSSHIRPPSRGTNNSYDNWKRAMGKTFRKSGTYFTPKDEETAKYARHVEEHLLRIFERKRSHTDPLELPVDLH